MKIFDKNDKVNFVDINNVFVGYDTAQNCCEQAGWFISDKEEDKIYDKNFKIINYPEFDVSGYIFDTEYFKEVDVGDELDAGGMIRFKLISETNPLYLHIYNSHNGYYGHGFEAKIGDESWKEGRL